MGAIIVLIIVAVLVVFGVFVALVRRGPVQLTRQLRSTSFSRRRADRMKAAAAADVAEIEEDDKYFHPKAGQDSGSELLGLCQA